MLVTKLRKVGGSVMLSVPPAMLEQLGLAAGRDVGLSVKDRQLVVEPNLRPSFGLDQLLAEMATEPAGNSDELWLESEPVGRELL